MGYSNDPAKRRRQLEALARSNPSMNVDELMARHDESNRATSDPPARPAPKDDAPSPKQGDHAPSPTAVSGVLDLLVTDADIVDEDGQLKAIFWADGADEEHPTLGIPMTDEAAIAFGSALDSLLDVEEAPKGPFHVAVLRVRDLDRTRWEDGMVARDEEPGRVEFVMTATDGREVTAQLSPEHTTFLRRWLKPGYFEAPREEFVVAVDPDAQRLEAGDHARLPEHTADHHTEEN